MGKFEKRVAWAIAHFGVAYLVSQEMKKRGKSAEDAWLAGHIAGAAAGMIVLYAL